MAATPSKASPKNSQEASKEGKLKDPPSSAVAAAPKDPPSENDNDNSITPTYEGTEASRHYTVAKVLLANGDFETALSTIEEGIHNLQQQLPQGQGLHEAMAPFHYLYGTTLLYSIEESTDPQQQMGDDAGDDTTTDDMQLAWEHLDLARTITETHRPNDKPLDLAQMYLRLGDLQRQQTGQEDAAILDYTKCLQLRSAVLPKYSRPLADVHYCLGLVYFSLKDTQNGTLQFYETGRIFAGIIAQLCGANPDQILEAENHNLNYKSTGDTDDDHPEVMVQKLDNLKAALAKLNVSEDSLPQVSELKELMDEIQETIQEAETSVEGVEQATELKEQIAAMVAATAASEQGGGTTMNGDGSTTTIGFGGAATEESISKEETTIGFGAASSATTMTAAQPATLVPKKKKKKAPPPVATQEELPPHKRPKTE